MKKIYVLLFVTACFAVSNLNAQMQKGTKLLGGGLFFSHGNFTNNVSAPTTQQKYNSVGISPTFGIFTKQNRLVGISLLYNHFSSSNPSASPISKSNNYGIGFFKQYWNSIGKKAYFNIQGQLLANFQHASVNSQSSGFNYSKLKTYGLSFSIDPGFAYQIKPRLILDLYYSNFLSTGYAYSKYKNSNPGTLEYVNTNHSFEFRTGLNSFSFNNFVFGFRYVL